MALTARGRSTTPARTHRRNLGCAVGLCLSLASFAVASPHPPARDPATGPIGVSPGDPEQAVASPVACPPFSWTLAADAVRYELVVLELEDDSTPRRPAPRSRALGDGRDVALRRQIPGGANQWLPPASECPTPGGLYAWSVRAQRPSGWSAWSDPLRFRTPGRIVAPSRPEPALALEPPATRSSARGETPAAISTPGLVESTSDGFRFPDGSVQERAFQKVVLHAAVSSTGEVVAGDPLSASNTNPGAFDVNIGRLGIGCTATATVGIYDPPEIAVVPLGSAVAVVSPSSLVVNVYTFSGDTATSLPFMLQVVCNGAIQIF